MHSSGYHRDGKAQAPAEPITCEADLAGTLVGVPAEHVAGTPILTGAGHKAGVRGRVLAVLSCEPWSTSAGGFPQHALRHTSTTILTAVFLTGVSMLAIFSQEALWTSVLRKNKFHEKHLISCESKHQKMMLYMQENIQV